MNQPNPSPPTTIHVGANPDELAALLGVGKAYPNGVRALDGLNLRMPAGEFACLVGPSGCGKSTALRLLAGLAEPTAGEIRWNTKHEAGDIGFVFQEPTLLPWGRVWENVYLPLRLRGEGRAAAKPRVDEALELVGLADFARAYPRELSGGMKMRVSIARALVTRPRLLLMDEPFAALDEITRFKLNDDLLRIWAEQSLTVLFVTHSVYESVYLAQRVLVMGANPGRIVEEVAVERAYPRDEAFRREPGYAATCGKVSTALRTAMEFPPPQGEG